MLLTRLKISFGTDAPFDVVVVVAFAFVSTCLVGCRCCFGGATFLVGDRVCAPPRMSLRAVTTTFGLLLLGRKGWCLAGFAASATITLASIQHNNRNTVVVVVFIVIIVIVIVILEQLHCRVGTDIMLSNNNNNNHCMYDFDCPLYACLSTDELGMAGQNNKEKKEEPTSGVK
jgi:hypothetical protein